MMQNPIEEVLKELSFTETEKKGFMEFLNYSKTCIETGNNKQLKSQLEQIVREVASKD